MTKENFEQIQAIVAKQEKVLRFEHFSNKDALDLGNFITNKIYDENMDLAIAIRKVNGAIVYQHMTNGTALINQKWMMRKFNTVRLMESSSLGVWAGSNLSGETVPVHGLSESDYVFCGGGFPIRLKTGELVAILTVSNLFHIDDHRFIVKALSQYLNIADVPQLPEKF